jgi:ketosteroid isomerase-like protein
MSQGNVEIVRLGYERLNAGDLEGFLQFCSPEFEFRDLPKVPGSGVYVGHDGFRRWWAQMLDSFEEGLRFETAEFIDAGGDRVVVVNHGVGQGRGSGANVEMQFSTVSTLRNGKLVKHIAYNEHVEALEAAGLGE